MKSSEIYKKKKRTTVQCGYNYVRGKVTNVCEASKEGGSNALVVTRVEVVVGVNQRVRTAERTAPIAMHVRLVSVTGVNGARMA